MIKTGIYNVVTDGFRWRHLIFYERDTALIPGELDKIHKAMTGAKSAYVVYTTSSGGFHVMGLTPVNTVVWAYGFKDLDMDLKGNYSGHVLRCNKKPGEVQECLRVGNLHDYVLADQIYNMARIKFDFDGYYTKGATVEKWKSVFCYYGDRIIKYNAARLPAMKRPDWNNKGRECIKPEGTLSRITDTFNDIPDLEQEA